MFDSWNEEAALNHFSENVRIWDSKRACLLPY